MEEDGEEEGEKEEEEVERELTNGPIVTCQNRFHECATSRQTQGWMGRGTSCSGFNSWMFQIKRFYMSMLKSILER